MTDREDAERDRLEAVADSGGRLARLVALWQKGERPPDPMVGRELSILWRRALWSWLRMTVPGLEVVAEFWARRRRGPEKGGTGGE